MKDVLHCRYLTSTIQLCTSLVPCPTSASDSEQSKTRKKRGEKPLQLAKELEQMDGSKSGWVSRGKKGALYLDLPAAHPSRQGNSLDPREFCTHRWQCMEGAEDATPARCPCGHPSFPGGTHTIPREHHILTHSPVDAGTSPKALSEPPIFPQSCPSTSLPLWLPQTPPAAAEASRSPHLLVLLLSPASSLMQ